MLTADQINTVNDVETRKVSVPEWGDHVYVRTIDLDEHKAWVKQIRTEERDDHATMILLLTMTLCDESGVRLYDWMNPEHAKLLAKKRVSVLERCYKAASDLNRLTDDEDEDLKKSEAGQRNGSSSG